MSGALLGEGKGNLFFWLFIYIALLQLTYFNVRVDGVNLYFAGHLEFSPGAVYLSVLLSFFFVLPALFIFLRRSTTDLFAFILAPLMLLGGASGVVVLGYTSLSFVMMYLFLYVLFPVFLLFINFGHVKYPRIRFGFGGGALLLFGVLGALVYLYLALKYRALLGLPSLADVYVHRSAFAEQVLGWEKYAIPFAKFVSAFCFVAYAIGRRRGLFVWGAVFILVIDYMLAGHKFSLALMLLAVLAYYWFAVRGRSYTPVCLVVPLVVFLIAFNVFYYFEMSGNVYMIGIYDRVFNVSSGLFYRYYEYANQFHFFGGGDGILGAVFGGFPGNYHKIVGEHYFSAGVSANADLISDAYINFGIWGAVSCLVILRLIFSRRDNSFYLDNREVLMVLMLPYALSLFSMGLQTTLLTGGMLWGLLVMKLSTFPSFRVCRVNSEGV